MNKTTNRFDILIEDMAVAIADSDDNTQSEFFNIFFKALRSCCENNYRYETQLCFIKNKLNDKAKYAFNYIGDSDE